MLHIVLIRRIVTIAALLCGIAVAQGGQVSGEVKASNPRRALEMTEVDVFAASNWVSDDVTILGFRLGMSRLDAKENARKQGLVLDCADYCDVCNRQNTLCKGVGLRFGQDDHVQSIFVVRPIAEASKTLRKFSVTQQFKGQTYQLFHNYSNPLRLKLFGSESRREEDSVRGIVKYFYPTRGVDLDVNLSPNKNVPESEADLIISFVRPEKPAQASKP